MNVITQEITITILMKKTRKLYFRNTYSIIFTEICSVSGNLHKKDDPDLREHNVRTKRSDGL